jgi:hypothetical protein
MESVKYDYAFKLECVKLVLKAIILNYIQSKKDQMNLTFVNGLDFIKNMEPLFLPRKNQSYCG